MLPLSDFQIRVLNFLRIFPSQLHPNAWGFILAFERLCVQHYFFLSVNVFHYFFVPLYIKHPSGYSCLSLKGHRDTTILKAYEESYTSFKEMYFWVRHFKDCWDDLFVVDKNEGDQ